MRTGIHICPGKSPAVSLPHFCHRFCHRYLWQNLWQNLWQKVPWSSLSECGVRAATIDCSGGPRAFGYGSLYCAHSHRRTVDNQFNGQLHWFPARICNITAKYNHAEMQAAKCLNRRHRERVGRSLPCFSHGLGHGHRHRASPNQKSPLFPEIVAQSSTGAPRRCVRLCSSALTSSRAGGGRELLVHGLEAIVRSRCCSGSVQPVGQSLRRSVQLCDEQSSSSTR